MQPTTGNLGTFVNTINSGLQFNWIDQFGNGIQLDFTNELPFVSVPAIGNPGDFWIDGFPYPPGISTSDVEPVATPEPATILCLLAAFAVALIARQFA